MARHQCSTRRTSSRRPRLEFSTWACLFLGFVATWGNTADAQGPARFVARPGVPEPFPLPPEFTGVDLSRQTAEAAWSKSAGCVSCHQNTGDPHGKETVKLGCVDCHGGNAGTRIKEIAHVNPRFPDAWRTSANPVRSYTLLNHESPEFNRFVNPGDLRIAHISCGTSGCHPNEVDNNRKSMMAHGAMLWEAALYNNGSYPLKNARFGESYSMNGAPQRLLTNPPPTDYEMKVRGVLPYLDPLPSGLPLATMSADPDLR